MNGARLRTILESCWIRKPWLLSDSKFQDWEAIKRRPKSYRSTSLKTPHDCSSSPNPVPSAHIPPILISSIHQFSSPLHPSANTTTSLSIPYTHLHFSCIQPHPVATPSIVQKLSHLQFSSAYHHQRTNSSTTSPPPSDDVTSIPHAVYDLRKQQAASIRINILPSFHYYQATSPLHIISSQLLGFDCS